MSEKYIIKDYQCKPISTSHLAPVVKTGHMISSEYTEEDILKQFFNVIGIDEFNVVERGAVSRKYLFKNKTICDFILSNAYRVRNPKSFLVYFNTLDARIDGVIRVIQQFRNNIYRPLQETYHQFSQATNDFHFKGNWMTSQPGFAQHCNRIIGRLIDRYTQGMEALTEISDQVNERYQWLKQARINLRSGISSGGLLDQRNASEGLKLYTDIVTNVGYLEKVLKDLTAERMKFIVYNTQEKRWDPGHLTLDLLHCLRNILNNELLAAHLYVHESIKEEESGDDPLADNYYLSRYLPEGESRDPQYYKDYRDTLLQLKADSRYISWLTKNGRVLYSEKIFND